MTASLGIRSVTSIVTALALRNALTAPGKAADVVLLDTRSVSDVILDLPARLMVLKRGKIVATSVCQRSVVF